MMIMMISISYHYLIINIIIINNHYVYTNHQRFPQNKALRTTTMTFMTSRPPAGSGPRVHGKSMLWDVGGSIKQHP